MQDPTLIFLICAVFLLAGLVKGVVGLAINGRHSSAAAGQSLLMLLPALAGMAAGEWLRKRLSPTLFRRCFLVSLILLGLHMVLREMLR